MNDMDAGRGKRLEDLVYARDKARARAEVALLAALDAEIELMVFQGATATEIEVVGARADGVRGVVALFVECRKQG